jgi:predicted DNA binding CopG/RHH family protein
MADKRKAVPRFASDSDEASFWATHDSAEYELGEEVEVEVSPRARTRLISIRLPEWLLADLKREAAELGKPYQRLVRETLERRQGGASVAAEARTTYGYTAPRAIEARFRKRASRYGAAVLEAIA